MVTLPYRNSSYSQSHAGTVSSIPGWQNLLPTDQGAIPSKGYQHPRWRNAVPNVKLLQEQHGAPYYGSASSYHHPTQSPDSSTGVTSFPTTKDMQEISGKGNSVIHGDKNGNNYCLCFHYLFPYNILFFW